MFLIHQPLHVSLYAICGTIGQLRASGMTTQAGATARLILDGIRASQHTHTHPHLLPKCRPTSPTNTWQRPLQSTPTACSCRLRPVDSTVLTLVPVRLGVLQETSSTATLRRLPLLEAAGAATTSSAASASANASVMITMIRLA
ncbi:hypothetical protein BJV77DRAFT_1033133 [Russula vinacea]|nr:hypothetical protein BJV77DRAFT_1033133 [Russula vinacea]